ncbi:MAG TPA: hypothetical protein VEI07_06965 [Planctomycetaceae bacterium]|nr:hypothetical protein [Planctomycetaceae bacterium]
MGFIVKITGHAAAPQWIGHSRERLVPRHEARVFRTELEAEREIDAVRPRLPDGLEFELENE